MLHDAHLVVRIYMSSAIRITKNHWRTMELACLTVFTQLHQIFGALACGDY